MSDRSNPENMPGQPENPDERLFTLGGEDHSLEARYTGDEAQIIAHMAMHHHASPQAFQNRPYSRTASDRHVWGAIRVYNPEAVENSWLHRAMHRIFTRVVSAKPQMPA